MGNTNCECKICGKGIYRRPSMIKNNTYCSIECRTIDFKKYKFSKEDLSEIDHILFNYEILKEGKVISKVSGKEVIFNKNNKGYLKARLHTPLSKNKDGRKPYTLHRLVSMVHLKSFDSSLQVNHKNGIKSDNHIDNLEMVTNSENVYHAWNMLDSVERKLKLNLSRDNTTGRFIKK